VVSRYFVHVKVFAVNSPGTPVVEGSGITLSHPLDDLLRLPNDLNGRGGLYRVVVDFYREETWGRGVAVGTLTSLALGLLRSAGIR